MPVAKKALAIHERLLAEQAEAEAQQIKIATDLARSSTQAALQMKRSR